jgi:hypothetical protein
MTRLDKVARVIFHEHDDKLLDYLKEEGQTIEPQWWIHRSQYITPAAPLSHPVGNLLSAAVHSSVNLSCQELDTAWSCLP